MVDERIHGLEQVDVGILGGGPAGLQAVWFFLTQEKKS
jgi:thioredoxin reductase